MSGCVRASTPCSSLGTALTLLDPPPPSPRCTRTTAPSSTPRSPTYKVSFFDTGTTGLSPDSSSLSALAVLEHDSPAKPSALALLHLHPPLPSPVAFVPPFNDVVPALRSFIESVTPPGRTPLLVAHNSPFDAAFLHAHLTRANLSLPSDWCFACSYALSRALLPFAPAFSLSQAALNAHFRVTAHAEHRAHHDVRIVRQVPHRLISHHKHPPPRLPPRRVPNPPRRLRRPLRHPCPAAALACGHDAHRLAVRRGFWFRGGRRSD
ncbi:unnamed protein product [Chondrus crispus]|uniref:Exonuclease domain-containing protein n=1 Tax=Chondrus crispus TaxID=2769 RepID=R7QK87_CHOCR|nr:unnamed protein product [Chondrus crispus]CDF38937.1 unnamed protein product [Chondrus crispus]|eukprot:XP_005718842.1 unnamed protein product [Chondrus crispus]